MSDIDNSEPDTVILTEEEKAARKQRNRVLGFVLFAFVGLIMLLTMLRLGLRFSGQGEV